MRRKLRQAARLSLRDWWLLAQAAALLLAVDLGLRLRGFAWTRDRLGMRAKGNEQPPLSAEDHEVIRRTAYLLGVAARYHPLAMRCLHRSLALQWMLRRQGIYANLRIGVRKDGVELSGHAWLEYSGMPLTESAEIEAQFLPLVGVGGGRLDHGSTEGARKHGGQ